MKYLEKLNDGWHGTIDKPIKKVAIDFEAYADQIIFGPYAIYVDYDFYVDVILDEGILNNGVVVTENRELIKKVIPEENNNEYVIDEYLKVTF